MATKTLMAFVAVTLITATAEKCMARLGETEAEIRARYGKPDWEQTKPEEVSPAEKHLHFRKGNIRVMVVIFKGCCASEAYSLLTKDGDDLPGPEAADQFEALLQANAGGSRWIEGNAVAVNPKMNRFWERLDGEALAVVWKYNPSAIEIQDIAFVRECRRSDEQGGVGLEGF